MGSQNQGSTTTTSAGNPDSLVTDKVDQKGQVQTSGQNLSETNYTNLPPNLTPTSDWPNALSFTNKNNAQRAQLFLHGLLGSIPVLVNKSGENNEKFQATDQKWSYTELKSDQTKLNLPAYGEVNGLLNPALVETYFGTTRTSSTANQNSTTVPGIGLKFPNKIMIQRLCWSPPGWLERPRTLVTSLSVAPASASSSAGGWSASRTLSNPARVTSDSS
ncbi:adhesin P1 homolog [Mycoplasmoides pneumoniae]|nr:adhesin P1 [Mycoplasmoides pneumoniae]BAL21776.1 adhesin P1 homolog [Mycoplasmoides pneumoniae 309]BAV19688.1 adhesin P1 homolog [Mycoplasmoides pneumoniae]BAV20426.1 adhesin P1 homolog [Mycoplasmoides pneumoniae]